MITNEEEANQRIKDFVKKYGNGKNGLNKTQKKERIKKVLGIDIEKFKGLEIKGELLEDLENYPKEKDSETNRITFIKVKDNGEINYEGIVINGKEKDLKTRTIYSVNIFDDETSARNELKQFQDGRLKEVSDRTMGLHKEKGNLKIMLDDLKIDTNIDKQWQI